MSDFDQFDSKNHDLDPQLEKEPEKEKGGNDTAQGGRKKEKMSGENSSGSGSGSGSGPTGAVDSVANTAGNTVSQPTDQVSQATQGLQKTITGLTKGDTEDMAGSLKIHVKLALEVDIRIIARLKGDIAIGIL
ncbi:uncharacterized protein A1O9_12644 [Exophiala aquamarina CBS 119918]|uniref:Uncharacterized protein n=1 Tax=Exophiala aquamarina CBS 119918 TaxID=1182545 RepID=A0A072NTX4_9EURO|nr:uncharacterized protein A1O9_12644 [Exophiala aquamarina CBS 119918]KEF51294.1 hypothetical protein A1O9_12644 [Exophiala aquamarina CBS 119918]